MLLSNSACQNHVRNKDPASLCLYWLVHVNMLFNFSQYIPGLALSVSYNVADFCWQMYFYYTFYINIYSTWHVPVLVCYNFVVHPCFYIVSICFPGFVHVPWLSILNCVRNAVPLLLLAKKNMSTFENWLEITIIDLCNDHDCHLCGFLLFSL